MWLLQEYSLNPVTAIAIVPIDADIHLLVVGVANSVRIFHHESSRLLSTIQVFRNQTIHGLIYSRESVNKSIGTSSSNVRCLLWGGRSICAVHLSLHHDDVGIPRIKCNFLVRETLLQDWIFDACLSPDGPWRDSLSRPTESFLQAVAVTAHNSLLSLDSHTVGDSNQEHEASSVLLCAGPSSIIYSAHILWEVAKPVIIAAGTVFGEVLLWRCDLDITSRVSHGPLAGKLLRSFTGHDGSVFGVRISDPAINPGSIFPERLLASCSDDRTLKLWDITRDIAQRAITGNAEICFEDQETGFRVDGYSASSSSQYMVSAVGHLSRIWDVRFPPSFHDSGRLVTFGEDSTNQFWCLKAQSSVSTGGADLTGYKLISENKFSFHAGKNIWGADIFGLPDGQCLLSTGGADGRIQTQVVSGSPSSPILMATADSLQSQSSCSEVQRVTSFSERDLFLAMRGKWILFRRITSQIPSQPSGDFKGIATLTSLSRPASGYDEEFLYSEEGEFLTDQGLRLNAHRRYIYRYQTAANRLTAWFVKSDNETAADYLFHELHLRRRDIPGIPDDEETAWAGSGHHLCIKDDYDAEYDFIVTKGEMKSWSLEYMVKGPEKDYKSVATYTKAPNDALDSDATKGTSTAKGKKLKHNQIKTINAFKSYFWIDRRDLLVITSDGGIWNGTIEGSASHKLTNLDNEPILWSQLGDFKGLESGSTIHGIPGNVALFTGSNGKVYAYWMKTRHIMELITLPGKVAYLSVHEADATGMISPERFIAIATCLGKQQVYCLSFEAEAHNLPQSTIISLNLLPELVVTSSTIIKPAGHLVLGSRDGAICVYDKVNGQDGEYSPMRLNAHGKDAIMHLQNLHTSSNSTDNYILSTGRSGKYAIHHISRSSVGQLNINTIHELEPPFGPNVEGASINNKTEALSLWGFQGKDFIVWNASLQQETMRVTCGGAHRSWAFLPTKDGGGSFVWTRASICHVLTQFKASHKVMQSGGHGREIKALAIQRRRIEGMGALIATGAEDTTIRILSYDDGHIGGFNCHAVISKHVTGIQALRWSQNGSYLFSCGGREEFFIWRVRYVPCIKVGVISVAKFPSISEDGDQRIMCFDILDPEDGKGRYLIAMVYSDSSIRVWAFDSDMEPGMKSLSLLAIGSYTTCCLTGVRLVVYPEQAYILTTATDGHLALFALPPVSTILSITFNATEPFILPAPAYTKSLHQSSIKSLDLLSLSSTNYLLATGGDDNALCLTLFYLSPSLSPQSSHPTISTKSLKIPKSHASAINAIQILPPHPSPSTSSHSEHPLSKENSITVLSASNDQILKLWDVFLDLETKELNAKKLAKLDSSIADVACIDVFEDVERKEDENDKEKGRGRKIVIGGIGLEVLLIK